MKKNILVSIMAIIVVILIITSLVVYSKTNNDTPTLQTKVSDEIKYLDNHIVSLLGHFNGLTVGNEIFQVSQPKTQLGKNKETNPQENKNENNKNNQTNGAENEQSGQEQQSNTEKSQTGQESSNSTGKQENSSSQSNEENTTSKSSNQSSNMTQNGIFANNGNYESNWESIELQIEQLYQRWNIISLDLHALNIDGKSILTFSDGLNTVTQNVKKKDKTKAMEELIKIYELLPQYMNSYMPNDKQIELLKLQLQVTKAYVAVTGDKWDEAGKQLSEVEKLFANMLNTVTGEQSNQATISQCYILVNELKSATSLKDKDIFYMQYQNFVMKMGILL